MKRVLSIILFMSILLVALVSCGGGGDDVKETTTAGTEEITTTEETEIETTEHMPARDFNGYVFRYLHGNKSKGITFDELDAQTSVVLQAKHKLNGEIIDKFNVDIEDIPYIDSTAIGSYVLRDAMGTEATYDVGVLGNIENIMSMVSQDVLMDINEMPYMDLSQDWYGGEANKAFEIMGKQYYFTSAFPGLPSPLPTLFNKNMMDELGLEYPYQLILDGKWTIEKMMEYTSVAYVDADGVAGPSGNDMFGYSGHDQSIAYFYQGMGGITSSKDENGALIPVLSNETVDRIFSKIQDFYTDSHHWINTNNSAEDPESAIRVFYDGRAMFSYWITGALKYNEIETFDYGLAILPKYDEDQTRYYVPATNGCHIMPKNMGDSETVGYIFEAFAEASWRIVYPASIQEARDYEQLPDEQSIEVKRLVDKSLTYDVLRKLDPSGGQLRSCKFILQCLQYNTTPAAAAPMYQSSYEKMFQTFFYPEG